MTVRNERRESAIERMADHLLREGISAASLRPLAAAAGTSDRMLLYYFADKDELIAATLERIAARLAALLDEAIPTEASMPFSKLVTAVWNMVGSAKLRPHMRLWIELAAAAGREMEPHKTIATGIMNGFVLWTSNHLDEDVVVERQQKGALLLATIEGALFLDTIGRRDLADMAIISAARQHRANAG